MSEDDTSRLTPKQIQQIARDRAVGKTSHTRAEEMSDQAEEEYRNALRENAPYLTLGMQMAATIALGAGVGWWIDQSSGSSIWLGICSGIGAVLGMGYFILIVLKMDRKSKL
ncbi:MAG TPA: AtpZ/AtpI family protein [Candidatus Kapabacteria bacterium]|nr:AtpZ/AtpI family protein [Candidatus Kapabacteria bacterium]